MSCLLCPSRSVDAFGRGAKAQKNQPRSVQNDVAVFDV